MSSRPATLPASLAGPLQSEPCTLQPKKMVAEAAAAAGPASYALAPAQWAVVGQSRPLVAGASLQPTQQGHASS